MRSPLLRSLPYFLSYLIPGMALYGMIRSGWWTFLAPAVVFGVITILELMLGTGKENPTPEEEQAWKHHRSFSLLLWGHVVSQTAILVSFFYFFYNISHTAAETIGGVISTGLVLGGIGITVAHELIHRSSRFEQFLGKYLLFSTNYLHFFIEHIRGHHKTVGTPEDPVSAPLGHSFYRIWFTAVAGSFLNAWHLEHARLRKKNLSPYSLKNQMVRYTFLTVMWNLSIALSFGAEIYLYYLVASVIGFSLLEVVNYIEHYGLSRNVKPDGTPEKIEVHHSWNSNNYLSRWFLFELTRHADHHLNASRPYQNLRDIDPSPQHPTGYPGMIVLALLPPLWFRVMDNRARKAIESQSSA